MRISNTNTNKTKLQGQPVESVNNICSLGSMTVNDVMTANSGAETDVNKRLSKVSAAFERRSRKYSKALKCLNESRLEH